MLAQLVQHKDRYLTFVTTRPFSLRNNLVNRSKAEEIFLISFAGSYSVYKYFFNSENLNLNLNSPSIWYYCLYFAFRHKVHTMPPYFCRTSSGYKVISKQKWPSSIGRDILLKGMFEKVPSIIRDNMDFLNKVPNTYDIF